MLRPLGAVALVILLGFLAGLSFGWWTADATTIGVFYLAAAIAILVDLVGPLVARR